MLQPRRRLVGVLFLVAAMSLSAAACGGTAGPAEDAGNGGSYPERPITFIVPYDPGGGSDRQFRRLQPHLEESLGVTINVRYVTGGDGAAGWQVLHRAEPDGYTLGNVVLPNIAFLALKGDRLGFDVTDLTYVTWTETTPDSLIVREQSPYTSLEEFSAAAKKDPGGLTIGGTGTQAELGIKNIENALGIDVTYVPVSGGFGSLLPKIQGGHLDAGYFGASHALEHPDTLRPLAISGTEPLNSLPDVPTFKSLGYEGMLLQNAWGIAAPPDTPESVLNTLNKTFNDAVRQVEGELKDNALTPLHMSADEASTYTEKRVEHLSTLLDEPSGG